MARMYAEFSGTITSDQEFHAFHPAFHVDGAKPQGFPLIPINAPSRLPQRFHWIRSCRPGRNSSIGLPACVDLNLPLLGWGYRTMLMRVGE
jgi:hypothetical protein